MKVKRGKNDKNSSIEKRGEKEEEKGERTGHHKNWGNYNHKDPSWNPVAAISNMPFCM